MSMPQRMPRKTGAQLLREAREAGLLAGTAVLVTALAGARPLA